MRVGHALAAQANDFARLRSGGNLQPLFSVQQGNIEPRAQRGLCETDRDRANQIVPLAGEERMLGNVNLAVKVSSWSAAVSRLSFTSQAKLHAVVDARRHFHFQVHHFFFATRSRALRTFVANHFAGAPAARAGGLDAEESLSLHDLAAPRAIATAFGGRSRFRAAAVAGGAQFVALDFDGPRAPKGRFAKLQFDAASQAVAAGCAAAPSAPRRAAEESFEQVAERAEDVVYVVETRLATAGARKRLVPVAVVQGAFLGVAQHVEGLGRLFEALDGRLVSRIAVGMVGRGRLAIRLLDLFGRGAFGDLQNVVIVLLCGHRTHTKSAGESSGNRRGVIR